MKRILILLIAACLFSCKQKGTAQSTIHKKYNPEAVKLNDSAIRITHFSYNGNSPKALENGIALLDKAITIDSNYYIAYGNKLSFQTELKQYSDAAITDKQLIRISPHNPDNYSVEGSLEYKMGDTLSGNEYFKTALSLYNNLLDTMSMKNRRYKDVEMGKAVALIMIGQQIKGNIILKQLYNATTDTLYRQNYLFYMNKSRQQLLDGLYNGETISSSTNSR